MILALDVKYRYTYTTVAYYEIEVHFIHNVNRKAHGHHVVQNKKAQALRAPYSLISENVHKTFSEGLYRFKTKGKILFEDFNLDKTMKTYFPC